jgi:hypothetical protein
MRDALASGRARRLLEDELKKRPTQYSKGPAWEVHTVVDRNPFTGQNPASSGPLARFGAAASLKALTEHLGLRRRQRRLR